MGVSIIIVNWNGERFIEDCLESLSVQSYKGFDLVFVDNASSDGSLAVARRVSGRLGLDARFVALTENRGYAGGNIEGLRHCTGDFIALLNLDACPDARWLEELSRAMEAHPEVGICASKLVVHGTDIIDSAGDGFSTFLTGFKRGDGERASLYDSVEFVFGACAGAALYRKDMLDEIGFLDEDFFLIHEDTDLNLRAHIAGWRVLFVPTAVAYHKVRSSIGHMSDTAVYYTIRNRWFVRVKDIPFSVFLRCLPAFVLGVITEFFYFAVKHGRPFLYLRAQLDALKMLPAMLRKRKAIMRARKAGYGEIMSLLTPVFEKKFFMSKLRKLLHG